MKHALFAALVMSSLTHVACGEASAVCGDGIVGGRETCDDGNTLGGDGCHGECQIENGYACPDGVTCDPVCGDGITVDAEVCDPSAYGSSQYCSADCTQMIAWCGDTTLQSAHETCDDGNTIPGDGCGPSCAEEFGFTCDAQGKTCDASALAGDRTIGSLTQSELQTFCSWLIGTLGGAFSSHTCGTLTYTVNSVTSCANALDTYSGPDTVCTVAEFESYVARSGSACGYLGNTARICSR